MRGIERAKLVKALTAAMLAAADHLDQCNYGDAAEQVADALLDDPALG